MGLRSTFRPRFGPFIVNTGRDMKPSSVSLKVGPLRFRVWSRKGTKSGVSSVDLPGPISFRPRERQRTHS